MATDDSKLPPHEFLANQLMVACVEWRAYVKKTHGEETSDDELLAMMSEIVKQISETETQRVAATKAYVEAERLPEGVSSLAKKRAEGSGWDKAKIMASSPFIQLRIPEELATRINNLSVRMQKSPEEIIGIAVARGVNAIERDRGPSAEF